jgi:hypothetical protein
MIGDLVHQIYAERRPIVPVVEGIVDQAVATQQAIVDGPGVNAHGRQFWLGVNSFAQADKQIPVELEDAPVQPIRDAYGVVGKAMHRLDAQPIWTDVAEHDPAAGSAEINRSDPPAGH